MAEGGIVGKVGILRLLSGLVILIQSDVLSQISTFWGLQPSRFVTRMRWASDIMDTSPALLDLGCPHSVTISTPSGVHSAPGTSKGVRSAPPVS